MKIQCLQIMRYSIEIKLKNSNRSLPMYIYFSMLGYKSYFQTCSKRFSSRSNKRSASIEVNSPSGSITAILLFDKSRSLREFSPRDWKELKFLMLLWAIWRVSIFLKWSKVPEKNYKWTKQKGWCYSHKFDKWDDKCTRYAYCTKISKISLRCFDS